MTDPRAGIALEAHLASARPAVLSALMRRFRDLGQAEDGYQAAALRALQVWPDKGVPRNPEAWLIRVGHNVLVDTFRKERRMVGLGDDIAEAPGDPAIEIEAQLDKSAFQDDVLRLLFLCCHPDLAPTDQMVLSLRYVLGLGVADIAAAFLLTPDTLQRRISRARKRAERLGSPADDRLAPHTRAGQIGQIRAVLYLMFNKGYAGARGEAHIQPLFCREAIRMTRLLLRILPDQPETMGLLSLMLGLNARAAARLDEDGALVALDRQDRTLWDRAAIAEARHLVQKALMKGQGGPYQLQAAICDVHNAAATPDATRWDEILRLYDALVAVQPTAVVRLNRLVALAQVQGVHAALAALRPLAPDLASYVPYHAVLAGLSEQAARPGDALLAYRAALECGPSAEERAFIVAQIARLETTPPGLSE